MYYLPILGALALGSGTVLQRFVLKKRKVNARLYQTLMFFAIFVTMIPLVFFFWKLDSQALFLKNVLIFLAIVIISVLANMFALYAMKWEKIEKLEPAKVLEPLFVILFAVVFSYIFGEALFERNTKILIPALIAGLALIVSHIEKHHLRFNKYFIAAIIGSFLYALELVMSKLILEFYTPISFYFLRCSAIFLISFLIFRPRFGKLSNKIKGEIFIIAIIWVVCRVAIYYGYMSLGVISTTLVIMLGPIFVYLFAHWFLHEKLHWKNIAASIVIVLCILYSVLA